MTGGINICSSGGVFSALIIQSILYFYPISIFMFFFVVVVVVKLVCLNIVEMILSTRYCWNDPKHFILEFKRGEQGFSSY